MPDVVWRRFVVIASLACCAPPPPPPRAQAASAPRSAITPSANPTGIDRVRIDAAKLEPTVTSPFAKKFLAATAFLPRVARRTIYRDATKKHYYDARSYAALPPAQRESLQAVDVDEELYYSTRYGSPLSYVRPLDVLAAHGVAIGPRWRVLDFGYGYVGHLRLLASLGLDANGVDVEPMLPVLYGQAGDQGPVGGDSVTGNLRLFHGAFPADPSVVALVGHGYDLVISKNVLKHGYIHPDRPADRKFLIDLGVSDETAIASFFAALVPGGTMLVYNICPALTPPDKPFVPWSDGRSPWSRAQWEAAGFQVVAFDVDDAPAVNRMGHLLGWGDDKEDPWDIDDDLSVLYTLVRRPQ